MIQQACQAAILAVKQAENPLNNARSEQVMSRTGLALKQPTIESSRQIPGTMKLLDRGKKTFS